MQLFNIEQSNLPPYFYIFHSFNSGISGQINLNNFALNKTIVSAGMSTALDPNKKDRYINGEINYLPFIKADYTCNSPSTFSMEVTRLYNTEHNLEVSRKQKCPKAPSRFSAIYAFGDYETCLQVAKRYNWDINSVKKFKLVNNDLYNPITKIGKYNMEIVSFLRGIDTQIFSINDQNSIYEKYWSCSDHIELTHPDLINSVDFIIENDIPIYEYLIEGVLELVEQ